MRCCAITDLTDAEARADTGQLQLKRCWHGISGKGSGKLDGRGTDQLDS